MTITVNPTQGQAPTVIQEIETEAQRLEKIVVGWFHKPSNTKLINDFSTGQVVLMRDASTIMSMTRTDWTNLVAAVESAWSNRSVTEAAGVRPNTVAGHAIEGENVVATVKIPVPDAAVVSPPGHKKSFKVGS